MTEEQIDALLVSAEKDIHYLTGFVGHESLAMVTPRGGVIVSDSRYDEYLQPWRGDGECEIVMGTRHRLFDAVADKCRRDGIRRLGVQADHLTVLNRSALEATLGSERLVDTVGLVGGLRMLKDAQEIATIERAIQIAQEALDAALTRLEAGMTESQFSATLEYEMTWRGASGAGFTPIIGSGANSSIIHHSTGHASIKDGILLVDWGCVVDGYNSDLTRIFAVGRFPEDLRQVYDIVHEAQQSAIDAIAPGRTCAEIDAVARRIITDAGYGHQFGHGLGHGLGMDVHEDPYFNALSTDVRLAPGMVMTVEPGIYLPGVGGVRIEDDIVVTETGCRVLSNLPKDFEAALLDMRPTADARP